MPSRSENIGHIPFSEAVSC